jgi:hypothetical protein
VSLIIGFVIGLLVGWYRSAHITSPQSAVDADSRSLQTMWRPVSSKEFGAPDLVNQNFYDAEPQLQQQPRTSFQTFDLSGSLAKQKNTASTTQQLNNIFVNDLKPNNSKLANGIAETSLRAPLPRQSGVYL